VVADIEELVRLRGVMYHDMGVDDTSHQWTFATKAILERCLPTGEIVGAVIDRAAGDGLCGGGLMRIERGLGSPRFPRGVGGHIGSVAVDPESRRRGYGEAIIRYLIDAASGLDLERVELHATTDGERIYRKLGFREREGGIELRLAL
jgi:ribosomal protein S18 acetylase RimI-like enzyme